MKTLRFSLHILAVALVVLAFSSVASAQATRTWVSGVGDDANPCSRTAPCKTFAGAISKTASGGEIDCLDPGGFGQVTIIKSITINCDQVGGILGSSGSAVVISGSGIVVTLRALDLQGIGLGTNGVNILQAAKVHLVDMNIYGFTGNGVNVAVSSTVSLSMQNVNIHECANGFLANATGASVFAVADLDHVAIWNTTQGIQGQNGSRITARNSTIFASTTGVLQGNLSGGGSTMTFFESSFTNNTTALQSVTGAAIGVESNVFSANGTVFNTAGGSITSAGDNVLNGNGATGALTVGGGIVKM